MELLTRDQILQISDIQTERVEVPEWGGAVLVITLTGAERDALEAAIVEVKGRKKKLHLENTMARLVAMSVVDENGKRLFSTGDIQALGKKSSAALQRVCEVAQRLSGLTQDDLEEMSKNSESGQPEDSPSG
jgi:hypothetical protein